MPRKKILANQGTIQPKSSSKVSPLLKKKVYLLLTTRKAAKEGQKRGKEANEAAEG